MEPARTVSYATGNRKRLPSSEIPDEACVVEILRRPGNSSLSNGDEPTPERVVRMHTHFIIVLSQLVSLLG
jgi:hypothetical protein